MAEYLFIQMTGYGILTGLHIRAYLDRTAEGTRYDSFIYTDGRTVGQKMDATFPEVTGDSHRMNGNHAVAVIWDAYCKGLKDFDLEAAYEACKGAITEKTLLPWLRCPLTELDKFYQEKGFFPALNPGEEETCKAVHSFERRQAVAVMLGNCYDNWCLAQIARTLNKTMTIRSL